MSKHPVNRVIKAATHWKTAMDRLPPETVRQLLEDDRIRELYDSVEEHQGYKRTIKREGGTLIAFPFQKKRKKKARTKA